MFLTETNIDNCQLSANVDGESSTAVSVVYKKIPAKTVEVIIYLINTLLKLVQSRMFIS